MNSSEELVLFDANGYPLEPPAARRKSIPKNIGAPFVLMLLGFLYGLLFHHVIDVSNSTHAVPKISIPGEQVTFPSSPWVRVDPPGRMAVSTGRLYRSLVKAVKAWERALGASIDVPPLFQQSGGCGTLDAIACVENEKVIVANDSLLENDRQLVSVMMHEVGHLLGVPHIEGDSLMNSWFRDTVEKPTEQAIAIARLHLHRRTP